MSADGSSGAASVLVVTNERDFAADAVIHRLSKQGVPVERWNSESFDSVSWRPEEWPATREFSAVWLRQFLAEPSTLETVGEVDDFLVVREQWRTWLADLAEYPGARWMNPLWSARRAENKLTQLRVASAVGMSVPSTVVTNSRDEAAAHEAMVGTCVVKAVASAYFPFSSSAFMFTRPLKEALDLTQSDWRAQPVVVQRTVSPRTDVRIFVVGRFVAAASTRVDATDWRTRAGEAVWERCVAPVEVVDGCRRYLDEFGLAYGAFDFAFDGEVWWFLECNQAGEFSFADRPLELGVADAIAGWLSGVA